MSGWIQAAMQQNTITAYTINCVCHSIRSMFRVLGTDFVQLLEFMKNFTQHPALVYRSAYTIFGTVTLWRFDALPATLESFKIWIADCIQRKVQFWPVIKNRPLLFLFRHHDWVDKNWVQIGNKIVSWGICNLVFNIVSTLV